MASWQRSSDRSQSPNSPLTPLSPHALPQWLRPGQASKAVIPPGKYKFLLVALGCMVLGWIFTSVLNPGDEVAEPFDNTYSASTGVLDDPTGFGADPYNATHKALNTPATKDAQQHGGPSIKGALADLHKAVSDKFSGWSGYVPEHNPNLAHNTNQDDSSYTNTSIDTNELIHNGLSDGERLGARTRIGKCTILFNGNDLWERSIRTQESHDRMHGYRLHVLRQHLLDDVWSKPAYILSLILRELAKPESERLEWLFWVDADTVLLNPYIPIEAFLPPPGKEFEHIHLLYSADWNGLNNGVFPIRVNKWAAELLGAIVSFRYYRPEQDLLFRDQSAMDIIMREPKFAKNIIQLPQRWFNAYQGEHNETLAPHQIRRGDLLVHFAGLPDRDNRMAFWLDRAEQHLEDWEVPFKSTSYPQEIKDFWAQQRTAIQNHRAALAKSRLSATELVTKVEKLLNDYMDRLTIEDKEKIDRDVATVKLFLGDEKKSDDLNGMNEVQTNLEASAVSLEHIKTESHKITLTTAHDAIFGGEKDLLAAGFYEGVVNPENTELDAAVKSLKELILITEDQWDRQQIMTAIERLVAARGRLKEKVAALEAAEAAKKKAAEEEKIKAAEEEKKKALQASQAAAANAARQSAQSSSTPVVDIAEAQRLHKG